MSAREDILEQVGAFTEREHAAKPFVAGETPVPASGKVFGAEEVKALVDASLDFWLTTGRYNAMFEKDFREFLGVKHALTVNSGSSANLVAFSALKLEPGDEVITAAAGFPTTVNPILQNGCVPVFVDVDPKTHNAIPERVAEAVGPKTKAIVLAHTLGNPFDLDAVVKIAKDNGLKLMEDCCDALGSTYKGAKVGTFGDVGTCSFYPAHHITMGEGGAVFTNDGKLKIQLASFRDWGRDCFCDPGVDNTCGKRFGWKLGGLPRGYDHKYIYSNVGYNLKITDMQAAVGWAQLKRLPAFIEARKANFKFLKEGLAGVADRVTLPEATAGADPAWFGFPMVLHEDKRRDLQIFLDERKIGSRLLFAGNMLKQPFFQGRAHRVVGGLENTDAVMERGLWVGVYPGLDRPRMEYLLASLLEFFKR